MHAIFWGVRGSVPTPGKKTAEVGGNTSCIELDGSDEPILLDAGTGLREYGASLKEENRPQRFHILLSHTHWDHIQGLPFFPPLYDRETELILYGPRGLDRGLDDVLSIQMQRTYFPVRRGQIQARTRFIELGEEEFQIGRARVATKRMNHPVICLGYSVEIGGRRVVYTGDNEPFTFCHGYYASSPEPARVALTSSQRNELYRSLVEFVKGAALVIADTQYTDEEYAQKIGWGHSPVSYACDLAAAAQVAKLCLFHHDPGHDDTKLSRMERDAVDFLRQRGSACEIVLAREGLRIEI